MDEIEQIIIIVANCLGLVGTATGFLIPLVKNVKAKNKLIAVNKLTTTLQALVVEAEEFTDFNGTEKKEYVMTKANRYAIENHIPFDEEVVSAKVEDLVSLSKEVNVGTRKTQVADTAALSSIRI